MSARQAFQTTHPGGIAGTHDWLTPPWILAALGAFDLDPCASDRQPWATACSHFTAADDGLSKPWTGRVWCNPPYGRRLGLWLRRCADHGNAIAFTFARTDTSAFFDSVWPRASAVLFMRGRVRFIGPDGMPTKGTPAGSVLIAWGAANAAALEKSGLDGAFMRLGEVA